MMHCRKCQKLTDRGDFCSHRCSRRGWLLIDSTLPKCYRSTDASRLPRPVQFAAAMQWARDILRTWYSDSHRRTRHVPPCLILHGAASGSGKTRTAAHVARLIAGVAHNYHDEPEECVRWLSGVALKSDYLEHARAGFQDWMEALCRYPLLIVDDGDKQRFTDGFNGFFFDLLESRLSNGNATVLTLNSTGNALAARIGREHGNYVVRRLREFGLAVNFDAEVTG